MRKLLFLLILSFLYSCAVDTEKKTDHIPVIVCTTGMLGDGLENILRGVKVEIVTLMKTGVDPHLYKATQGDVKSLMRSDIVVYNGLHLEGKMGDIFSKLENRKTVIVAADGIPQELLINNSSFKGAHDPHIWFDVGIWTMALEHIAQELMKYPTLDSALIARNWNSYKDELQELDQWTAKEIASIPKKQRTLITSHDAFSYFGRAYHIPVKGLQGISTVAEYGVRDVTNLVDYIISYNIKAVFIETSVSSRSMRAVVEGCRASGHPVKIGGALFSDSMGEEGTVEGTYLGMVKHNVQLICNELK